ncbi:MAG: cobalamin-dependent protein [Rubrivivax sp.]
MNTISGADILLVGTPLQAGKLPGGVCPSLANLTLGTSLRARGFAVDLLDPSVDLGAEHREPKTVLAATVDAVLAARPRLVGITALSPTEGRFGAALARALKQRAPALPIVAGGVWAMAVPEPLLARCPEIDGIVVGPGEEGAAVLARQGLARPDEVPGLVWRHAGSLVHNEPLTQPGPSAPLDMTLMRHPEAYDIFCWLTSRGCPYHCAFCTERLGSPRFTADPVAKVADDIAAFKRFGRRWYLWICDALFGASRTRLAQICDALQGAGLEFLAESRVDVLRPDDVPRMRAAGCNMIYFGLEAVSRRSLVALDKIEDRPERHRRYVEGARALTEACLRNDVLPVFGVLNPVPGDAPEDLAESLELLDELSTLAARLGPAAHGIAPCFHAFPLRFDAGAPYEQRSGELAAAGVRWSEPPDPLFGDRYLTHASARIGPDEAEAFRAAVRARNSASPLVQQRLLRSFPRPYVEFDA